MVAGGLDGTGRAAWFTTEDGYHYAKFAIRIGAAANGLTWSRRADGFFELSLGSTNGVLPIGPEGDGLSSEVLQFIGGKRVVRAVADQANRISHAVTTDGYLRGKLGVVLSVANGLAWKLRPDGLTTLALGSVEGELPLGAAGDVIDTKMQRYHRGRAVAWGTADTSLRGGLIQYVDGSLWAKAFRSPSIAPTEASLDFADHIVCTQVVGEGSQLFAFAKASGARKQLTSVGSNSSMSRSVDGTKVIYSTDRHGASIPYYQFVGEWIEHPVMPRRAFVAAGDSLTAATGATNPVTDAPVAIVGAHFGLPFVNLGQPGATAEGEAAFIGAVDPLVTFASNQIVSGSNTITSLSIPFLSRNFGTGTLTQKRTIAGIVGTVTKTGGTAPDWRGSYVFTPDAGQTLPAACPAGSPALLADNTNDELIAIIRVGRNTINGVAFDAPGWSDDAFLRTQQIVAWHKPLVKHFVVLPVPNGNYASEYQGASGYNALMAHNARLAAAWPDNYFDDRAILVAAYDPGNAQDVIDHGRDVPPSSLRSDNIHYNTAGYAVLGAAHWAFVEAKGWLTNPLLAPYA
ncbi:lysophospholipase L1-like esterase [Novosphingobium fluoreni]|uniref:Lysophospholipase L1-like esterase n=1 Tax=Novosphingobium fluoreni TaxID=1391222 RepID=A0A7W6FYW2_9SPHN|nr:hypothetical protein [Novosphingobium fluoreni]MBB3940683.1 lysophospholipase L1-like esterase [Novosphingobium fluoreni]